MKEVKIDKGLIKFNVHAFSACSIGFVLLGICFARGTIGDLEEPLNYLSSGILGVNAIITGKYAYNCHKILKRGDY